MKKSYSLSWLADYLGGEWRGNPQAEVDAIGNLISATESQLSFLNKKQYAQYLDKTKAGIVIIKHDQDAPDHLNTIRVADAYQAYAKISGLFDQRIKGLAGIHPSAVVHETAEIAESASIGANCVVEAYAVVGAHTHLLAGVVVGTCARIGADSLIYPNTVVYHGVTIGDRVTIHACSAIGSDGFGFAPSKTGWIKIHQLGAVVVGNDVEIGSCTSIDRGAIDDTVIEDGVIIDNQVHIAHNVHIGRSTAIAGCVGIAGSTHIGAHCTIGGFVAINGHLTIGDNVHFNGGTVVTKSVKEAGLYSSGTIMQDAKSWRKNAVRLSQLDEWIERIKKLEKGNE